MYLRLHIPIRTWVVSDNMGREVFGTPKELDVAALVSSEAYLSDAVDGASTAYAELADQAIHGWCGWFDGSSG